MSSISLLPPFVVCGDGDRRVTLGFGVVEFNDIWVCEDGIYEGALELFKEMKRDGFEPDEMTVVSVLGACGDLGLGKVVEEYVVENEMEVNSYVGSALIGMYSKCGDLVSARRVFDKMVTKDLVTWNAMITGFCIVFTSFELSMVVPVGAYVSGGHVKATVTFGSFLGGRILLLGTMEQRGFLARRYWNCTLDKFVEASMIPRKKCPQACRTRDVALRKRNQQTIDIMLLGSEIRFFRMLQLIRVFYVQNQFAVFSVVMDKPFFSCVFRMRSSDFAAATKRKLWIAYYNRLSAY
ncbi:pentatricopeptide repeat-containing protein [Tanacetum coccineum]